MKSSIISASLLAANFLRLEEEIRAVESAGADWLHLDVMDGHFVPNLTWGPFIISQIKKIAKIPLDVHLMIANADLYLEDYVRAGADYLSVHPEASPHLHRTVTQIRKLGAKPAVALNPHTPLSMIEYVLEEIEMVMLMSVNPGFGGQSFIPSALSKARELKSLRESRKLKFIIEMDGGIKLDNIDRAFQAGVEAFVIGSGIFNTPRYDETIQDMRRKIGSCI